MSAPTLTLTAYNTGFETEAEWDAWTAYVAANVDEACGFGVDVDSFALTGRGAGGTDDEISDATDEQEGTIREALSDLWDRWCSEGAP